MSSYKNNRLCYIPEHLIIRTAEKIFVGDTPTEKDDEYMRDRADFALGVLIEYTKALKPVRAFGPIFDRKYVSGL